MLTIFSVMTKNASLFSIPQKHDGINKNPQRKTQNKFHSEQISTSLTRPIKTIITFFITLYFKPLAL